MSLEAALEWQRPGRHLRAAVFRNDITGFFPRNTGEFSLRRGDLLLYLADYS